MLLSSSSVDRRIPEQLSNLKHRPHSALPTGVTAVMAGFDYDVVIVGSGFGGSIAALRAAEKGYRVGVMEAGRRWDDEHIPRTNWDLKDYVWFPAAEMYGIQRIEYLDDVLILCGAGVGGGLTCLWQYALCPSQAVLRCTGMGGHHRLGRRTGALLRPGKANVRCRPLPLHAYRCR